MEERKTIFDYLGQVFATFGITVMLLIILGHFFGEDAREISALFQLGSKGLSSEILLQFFVVAIATTVSRFLFFTDILIKQMHEVGRIIGMLTSIVVVIVGMTLVFDWFPIERWEAWAMFFLCFAGCFVISITVTSVKEKMENQKMAEALEKLKLEENRRLGKNGKE